VADPSLTEKSTVPTLSEISEIDTGTKTGEVASVPLELAESNETLGSVSLL